MRTPTRRERPRDLGAVGIERETQQELGADGDDFDDSSRSALTVVTARRLTNSARLR